MTKDGKKWYQSKTIVVNGLLLVAALLSALANEYALSGTLTVASLLNIALRIVTTSKIQW